MALYAVLPLKQACSARASTPDSHHTHILPAYTNKQPNPCTTQAEDSHVDHIMAAQATTPQRVRPDGLNPPVFAAVQGTPQNRGSSSRSHRDDTNGITTEPQRICLDYDDYIREDLSKHRVYISFENGLKILLNVPENWQSGRHEYSRIISKIREDVEYNKYWTTYLDIYKRTEAIETLLYEPQAALYNHTISLINKICNAPYRKAENTLLHFQKNHPTQMTQGIFTKTIPDITAKFQPLKDRDPLVWPMIVHIEETKDSDVALDRGRDGPRARNPGEKDPISEHRRPCRKDASVSAEVVEIGAAPTRKRKSGSVGFTANKAPRTSKTPSTSTAAAAAQYAAALNENQKTAGARLQCARYLMEMLELSILRSHAFLTLVDRDHLQLMYADRSAIVTTSIIDLTTPEGETMFLAMLIAFHHLTPEQWGFLSLVENSFPRDTSGDTAYHREEDMPTAKSDCLKGLTLRFQSKVGKKSLCLTLQEILYHQPGIIGRGTCVVGASCNDVKDWKDYKLAVKVSWPSRSRESEISLLARARAKGKELFERRRARRGALDQVIEKLQEDGKLDEAAATKNTAQLFPVEESGKHWALNHLPNILHSEDFELNSPKVPMPQAKLALFLSGAEFINGAFCYDSRALRISVQERLYKLTSLSTQSEYAQAFYDVLTCHRWMYDFPRILHRDISSGNIMYRIIEGKAYGVLNDLDLSSPREHTGGGPNTSSQRTGTPPYMALELLRNASSDTPPICHLYRHDLESLTYVILMLCSRNKLISKVPSIERLPQPPFDEWFDSRRSWQDLSLTKLDYLSKNSSVSTDVDSSFAKFIPWLKFLLARFSSGVSAKNRWKSQVNDYHSYIMEVQATNGPSGEPESDLLYHAIRAMPATEIVERPPPFEDETLDGNVAYLPILKFLSNFGGERLMYRNKDFEDLDV